jgi:hypothetical protein
VGKEQAVPLGDTFVMTSNYILTKAIITNIPFMAKNSTIASVLAFEKKLVPSDGFMYGTTWQDRNKPEANKPLVLREKSVRGTQQTDLNLLLKMIL